MLKTNQYFDGKVASIAFQGEKLPATVGVITPGKFTFDTKQKEVMTVVSGVLKVDLPQNDSSITVKAFESFTIEANQTFDVEADADVAYLCTYE
ncbi:MAG: pyrimidine/purine nucleoside phosphorylase [Cellvibrionales bacterium]|nr:pyrimidine/purine nucleoside phosphorylase [Cellvibrionales bacterium]